MKPDPRIFRLALDVLGVEADRVWYVGDMPGIDVVGAWRAGLRPFLIDPLGLHCGAAYDRVASLAELAEKVDDAVRSASRRFSLASACAAAREDRAAVWVGEFLASRGSDNAVLAAGLAQQPHWWVGPLRLPLAELVRVAGPEDNAVCPIEPAEWEHDVAAMEDSIEHGWEPPPLLVEYRDGELLLQDGTHRGEALVRAGETDAWVMVWFDDPAARDAFVASRM
jgi:hypothetical protein